MFFNFFKKSTSDNYYELGGPRSFYKFTYGNKSIILIGEVHSKMPNELMNHYIDIINRFVEKNCPVSLFLESSDTDTVSQSAKGLGFIASMHNLTRSPNLEIIAADKRDENNDNYEGFLDLFCFLNKLAELEKSIIKSYKEKHITPPQITPFFQIQDFIDAVSKIGNDYKNNYYYSDLSRFLETQIIALDALADKYTDQNKQVRAYIVANLLEVNDALELLKKLGDEYLAMGFKESDLTSRRLIDICIDMMSKKGNYIPAGDWLHIYTLYEVSFLDATLICDIWDKIHSDNNERNVMVVMGDAHIANLSVLLNLICDQEASIPADPKGGIISPTTLNEFLDNHFEHAPSQGSCIIV